MTVLTSLQIELGRKEDLPAVRDLLRRADLPLDGLDRLPTRLLVARAEDEIVGAVALEEYGRSALLRSLVVDENAQGSGIGQRLCSELLSLAVSDGYDRIYLLTTTAAAYFPRFGFRPVDRNEVDLQVQQSVEFAHACPASAQAMVKE